jgi:hypothetical protein
MHVFALDSEWRRNLERGAQQPRTNDKHQQMTYLPSTKIISHIICYEIRILGRVLVSSQRKGHVSYRCSHRPFYWIVN